MSAAKAETAPVAHEVSTATLKRDRLTALLRQQGIEPRWDAPPVTTVQHSGGRTGAVLGRDVNPEMEYVRAPATSPSVQRFLDRGYAFVDPGKDVRVENCQGVNDVILAVPRAIADERRKARLQRRKQLRASAPDAATGGAGYTSDEGVFKRAQT